tara:strand:- start:2801 stop:3301 length:501 start_codon:yes stop_codon:yes gene_type:complete
MIFLGVDPGKDGAIVAIDDAGKVVGSWMTKPEFTVPIGKGSKREYAEYRMAEAIQSLVDKDRVYAAVEKQGARPGQGGTSMLSIGLGWGLWRGILASYEVPVISVHPKTWMSRVLRDAPGQGKGRSILVCEQRVPGLDLRPGRRRKAHDGLADAACLALYALIEMR